MSSSYGRTRPSFTSHSRSATSSTRCGSWLTRITAPPYSVSASTSASRLSMSRWLVGSSRMIICGASSAASKQRQPRLLPPRQPPHLGRDDVRPDPARRQPPAQLPRRLVRPQPLQVLQRRLVELELVHLMLGEIPDAQLRGRHLPPAPSAPAGRTAASPASTSPARSARGARSGRPGRSAGSDPAAPPARHSRRSRPPAG